MFATTKLACKRMLRENQRYLTEHAADWFVFRFPARRASYWDPVDGMGHMKRDGRLTGKVCARNCKCYADGVPQWTVSEYRKTHAWPMGLWEHPDMLEAIKESIDIVSPPIPLGAAADVELSVRMARMGVNVHPVLDEFYDEYLGIAYVSSMWTERMRSRLKRQIGGLNCIN
jgi:hypothetical protein